MARLTIPLAQALIHGKLSLRCPDNNSKSVRTRNGHHNKPATEATSGPETWGFGTQSFTATPAASSNISKPPVGGNNVHLFGDSKKIEGKLAPQPAEWAVFLLIW